MRALWSLSVMAVLAACTSQDVGGPARSAAFPEFPENLFAAFEAACADPGQEFRRVEKGTFECRQLLPPETTAYLILNFDGYPQKLPESVIQLSSTQTAQGYQVDADMFLLVPQKSGRILKIAVKSPTLDRKLARLYRVAGGTPI
ncbi:hypothetical protein AVO45_02875 [Ruegeria marisrubri]|uniref:Lipoprotein n=2 Tax=Ruegeria marisrubri TaxID=1685379 RepID=A0A101CZN1_9RHOB|nr:hypothetical protein AVO45_02875 [Ruegeria marisrubri]